MVLQLLLCTWAIFTAAPGQRGCFQALPVPAPSSPGTAGHSVSCSAPLHKACGVQVCSVRAGLWSSALFWSHPDPHPKDACPKALPMSGRCHPLQGASPASWRCRVSSVTPGLALPPARRVAAWLRAARALQPNALRLAAGQAPGAFFYPQIFVSIPVKTEPIFATCTTVVSPDRLSSARGGGERRPSSTPGGSGFCSVGSWRGCGITEGSDGSLGSCTAGTGGPGCVPVSCRAGHPPGLPTPSSPPCCLSSVAGDRSAVTTSSESHSRLQE